VLLGGILPPDNDPEALLADTNWRYIFAAPVFISILILMGLMVVYDSPKHYINKNDYVNATKSVEKIYKIAG